MTTTDVENTRPGVMATARTGATKVERYRAFAHAMEIVDDPRCPRPIPRFMLDLPWVSDDDPVAERIIAAMLAADDPYEVGASGTTEAGLRLVGKRITIEDLRVHASDKPNGWGAYLLCDCYLGDDQNDRVMINTGAKQVVALLAYAWAMGDLPVAGTFQVVTETGKGNTVLGFAVTERRVGEQLESFE